MMMRRGCLLAVCVTALVWLSACVSGKVAPEPPRAPAVVEQAATEVETGVWSPFYEGEPGANVRFIDFQPQTNRTGSNWGAIMTDVIQHLPSSYGNTYYDNDRITHTHETSHGIHSHIRNTMNNTGQRANGFYLPGNRAVVIVEPGIRKSDANRFVPSVLRGQRYNLYMAGSQSWDDTPLYIWDEWNAYVNGGVAGVEMVQMGLWGSEWRDGVAGQVEFTVYALAIAMATREQDPTYFESNTQFLEFLAFNTARAMDNFREGRVLQQFTFDQQDQYFETLKNDPAAEPIRAFAREIFGERWANAVLLGNGDLGDVPPSDNNPPQDDNNPNPPIDDQPNNPPIDNPPQDNNPPQDSNPEPCVFNPGSSMRMGQAVPALSWQGVLTGNGGTTNFSFEDFKCGSDYADKGVLIMVMGTGWCGACPQYFRAVAGQAAEIEAAGGQIVFVELQDSSYQPVGHAQANQIINRYVTNGAGLRIGDGQTSPTPSYLLNSGIAQAYPQAIVIRKSDMTIVADQNSSGWQLDLVGLARQYPPPVQNNPNPPNDNNNPNPPIDDQPNNPPNDDPNQPLPPGDDQPDLPPNNPNDPNGPIDDEPNPPIDDQPPIGDQPGNPSPEDLDGDGIGNDFDLCGSTPLGSSVWQDGEWMGCAGGEYRDRLPRAGGPDVDFDGILDANDLCSQTPTGALVWSHGEWMGCAEGQLRDRRRMPLGPDADNDGVEDVSDLCSNTPSGAIVWIEGAWMGCGEGQYRD